jgi:hypothetical protein
MVNPASVHPAQSETGMNFGEEQPYRRPVKKFRTSLTMTSGELLEGFLFVPRNERVVDMMNDDRSFVPFEMLDGSVVIIAKAAIARVTDFSEQKAPEVDPSAAESPHRVLGVLPSATEDEIRQAYLALVRRYHPDQWNGVQVPEGLMSLARERLTLINAAYQKLSAKRRVEA